MFSTEICSRTKKTIKNALQCTRIGCDVVGELGGRTGRKEGITKV